MTISVSDIERRVEQGLRSWESSCPEQSFADMTLEQAKQALQPFTEVRAKFATVDAKWVALRQERNLEYAKALDLIKCVANSVKGHPRYGEDSALYAAMGYVPKSERGSGLTRKREARTEKESTEAS
jgi:hypothetical protein